jgi:carbonic anhydrase
MNRLIAVANTDDIFPEYKDTPIGLLLEYHNINRSAMIFVSATWL